MAALIDAKSPAAAARLATTILSEIDLLTTGISSRAHITTTGLLSFSRSLRQDAERLGTDHLQLNRLDTDQSGTDDPLATTRVRASIDSINRTAQIWAIVKRCRGFISISQSFQGSSRDDRRAAVSKAGGSSKEKAHMHKDLKGKGRAIAHVVDWGAEWLDVRMISADRLARQMTDSGWAWGDHELGDVVEDEWESMPLAKQVAKLIAAAKANPHDYHTPRIRIVLPNITRGESVDVDVLLDQLSRMDPRVTIDDASSEFLTTPPPSFDVALADLVGDVIAEFLTPSLAMDHTVLIDLASDITHLRLKVQLWQEETTRSQIDEENAHAHTGGFALPILYPVLAGRELVCTLEAAVRFHDVLRTVGTTTEKERGRLLVPLDPETATLDDAEIRQRWQDLSAHPLPGDVHLPISIDRATTWSSEASVARAVDAGRLPAVALTVVQRSGLKDAKLSTYIHGWATGRVAVTSNKEVRGQIRTLVEAGLRETGEGELESWPRVWRIDVTRNLLAKNASPRVDWIGGVDPGSG